MSASKKHTLILLGVSIALGLLYFSLFPSSKSTYGYPGHERQRHSTYGHQYYYYSPFWYSPMYGRRYDSGQNRGRNYRRGGGLRGGK